MPTTRQRLETALNGETPDRTPLSIYSFFLGDIAKLAPAAQDLVDRGLGIIAHCSTVAAIEHGVENVHEEKREGDRACYIYTRKTPVGDLRMVSYGGRHQETFIKAPGDYKIWQWIVEHTELQPAYDNYHRVDEQLGQKGIPIVSLPRTPAMNINIDIAGTEKFCLDVALEVPELHDLYRAMVKLHRQYVELAAAGPGRFIKWLENLTISMLGPKRYGELLLPVYTEMAPLLAAAGKRTMVHYDGQLDCIKDMIATAPFDIIESITEPPEGDMPYDVCRRTWPDKAFWANINVPLYYGPAEQLRQAVIDKRERAGKAGLAFEVSEDMPQNWQESIPVVLDTLEELD